MASTFDIRFARSVGLAALFEAPANDFRWKGAGKFIIEARAIRIAAERGPLSWFARRDCRIPAERLTEVYREGDALRIEYDNGAERTVMPVWARDSATAARIVKLLPTGRTVELEQVSRAHRYRLDIRLLMLLLAGVLAVFSAAIWLRGTQPLELSPAQAVSNSVDLPEGGVPPVTPMTSFSDPERSPPTAATSFGSVRNTGRAFKPEAGATRAPDGPVSTIRAEAAAPRDVAAGIVGHTSAGYLSPVSVTPAELAGVSAQALMWELFDYESSRADANDATWWDFTVRIHTDPRFQHQSLWALRENMLAISRAWRAGSQEMALRLTVEMRTNF